MTHTPGTRGSLSHPDLPKMRTMTGTLLSSPDGTTFVPDEKYHHKLFDLYGLDALDGLSTDGATFTPAE